MAARKPFAERRKLALRDFREQAIEAQSQLSSIVLVADNGEEFEVPHPLMVSDETQKCLNAVQLGQDFDKDKSGTYLPTIKGKPAEPFAIRQARALLGEDEHKRFIAAGGHSNDITLAWNMLVEEQQEAAEADPK